MLFFYNIGDDFSHFKHEVNSSSVIYSKPVYGSFFCWT